MHVTRVLMDDVGKKVVVLVLRGMASTINTIIELCRGHLREAGSKNRRKIVERCLESIKENLSNLSIQCLAISKRKWSENKEYVISRLSEIVSLCDTIELAFEEGDVLAKEVANALMSKLANTKKIIQLHLGKKAFGIVEVFGRNALLKQTRSASCSFWIDISKALSKLGIGCVEIDQHE